MDLDNINEIKELDPGNVYGSVDALPEQMKQAWNEASKLEFPREFNDVKQAVFIGMGGSNLGFRIVRAVFQTAKSRPFELVNSYDLPAYINEETLVIASSYSGNTEETLMAVQQANKQGAKIIATTTGGQLAKLAEKFGWALYQFNPLHNPGAQPRLGIGYSLCAVLAVFAQLGMIEVADNEVQQIIKNLKSLKNNFVIEAPLKNNPAKEFALQLKDKAPIWIAAQHLSGNTRVANNQCNETAKLFSSFFTLPELNHHLMEGLKNPGDLTKDLAIVAFNSEHYHARLKKRLAITKEVVEKNGVSWLEYTPQGKSLLGDACESLLFTSFVTFYLSMLYGQDPQPIPWVDYFKKKLG